ncbi:hypothetical protein D3C86_1981490 [compost metagenome]
MPENSTRPGKRAKRVSDSAARVPRMVPMVALRIPTRSVTQAASISPWFDHMERYHCSEKPPQTVTSLEALKE